MREKSETRIVNKITIKISNKKMLKIIQKTLFKSFEKVYNNNIKSEQEEMFSLFTDYLLGIQMQSANNDSGIV